MARPAAQSATRAPLYTSEQRLRRDRSRWTIVQGILAPLQLFVMLGSVGLVLHYLVSGEGYTAATASIILKTLLLYAIMITGSLWEHAVFGKYLFAPAFFWEDAVSMVVIALHTAYLVVVATHALDARGQMALALVAYASYAVNAAQFLIKLRVARRERPAPSNDGFARVLLSREVAP